MMKKITFISLLFVLLLVVGRVAAHAELQSAVPAPGAKLTRQPEEIRLGFSEPVGPESTIMLFGEEFQEINGVFTRVVSGTPEQLVATVPELAPGTYSVQWRVVSDDGHPASGSYTFDMVDGTTGAMVSDFPVGALGAIIAAVVIGMAGILWIRLSRRNED